MALTWSLYLYKVTEHDKYMTKYNKMCFIFRENLQEHGRTTIPCAWLCCGQ